MSGKRREATLNKPDNISCLNLPLFVLLAFTPSDFPLENSRHVDQASCQWPFPLSRFQERARGEERRGRAA